MNHLGKNGNAKRKRGPSSSDVKVVYISSPLKVKTCASSFRDLVQHLTGRDSDTSRVVPDGYNSHHSAGEFVPLQRQPPADDDTTALRALPVKYFDEDDELLSFIGGARRQDHGDNAVLKDSPTSSADHSVFKDDQFHGMLSSSSPSSQFHGMLSSSSPSSQFHGMLSSSSPSSSSGLYSEDFRQSDFWPENCYAL